MSDYDSRNRTSRTAGEDENGSSPVVPPEVNNRGAKEPATNDVLCGHGGSINSHPGNEWFRTLVERRKPVYLTAQTREEKRLIASSIVREIKALNGRFLQRDAKSGLWKDIGDEKARDKTRRALRENTPSNRNEIEEEARSSMHGVPSHAPHHRRPPSRSGSYGSWDPYYGYSSHHPPPPPPPQHQHTSHPPYPPPHSSYPPPPHHSASLHHYDYHYSNTHLEPTIGREVPDHKHNNIPGDNDGPPQRRHQVSSNKKRGRPRGSTKKDPPLSSTRVVDRAPQVAESAKKRSSEVHHHTTRPEPDTTQEDDDGDMMEDDRKPAARPTQHKKKVSVTQPQPFARRSNSKFSSQLDDGNPEAMTEDDVSVNTTDNSSHPTAKPARTTSDADRDDADHRHGTPKKSAAPAIITFPHSTPTPQEIDSRYQERLDSLYQDMIEYEQEVILNSPVDRKAHWKVLEHLLVQYTHGAAVYGRVYVRTTLCMLLYDACSEPGYNDTSLLGYSSDEWQELIEDLENTRTLCLQQDCMAVLPHDGPNPTKDETRSHRKAFTDEYKIVSVACTINRKIAPIRKILEGQIEATGGNGPVQLKSKKIVALLNSIDDDEGDVVKHYIYSLFVHDNNNEQDKDDIANDNNNNVAFRLRDVPTKAILKDLGSLRDILYDKPFDLRWLQTKLEALVGSWKHECFGGAPPNLVIGYGPVEDWASTATAPNSKRRRRSMNTNRMPQQTIRQISCDREEPHVHFGQLDVDPRQDTRGTHQQEVPMTGVARRSHEQMTVRHTRPLPTRNNAPRGTLRESLQEEVGNSRLNRLDSDTSQEYAF